MSVNEAPACLRQLEDGCRKPHQSWRDCLVEQVEESASDPAGANLPSWLIDEISRAPESPSTPRHVAHLRSAMDRVLLTAYHYPNFQKDPLTRAELLDIVASVESVGSMDAAVAVASCIRESKLTSVKDGLQLAEAS